MSFLRKFLSPAILLSAAVATTAVADPQYTIAMLQNTTAVENAYDVMRGEFTKAGLVEDRDYLLNYSTALGDYATMVSLIDAAVEDKANLIIALQTVTLQASIRRAPSTPIVFHVVSDPFIAGVGRSDTDKLPNVTGVYFGDIGADTQIKRLNVLKRVVPNARRIGLLFSPSDPESVRARDTMIEAAQQLGLRIESVPVTSADTLNEAAQALVARNIDAIQLVNSSVISASFEIVLQVARRNRVPIFGHSPSHVLRGSVAAYVPDMDESARQAAAMALRVLKGESPADIPLKQVQNFTLHVSKRSARQFGLTLPDELVKTAAIVIE